MEWHPQQQDFAEFVPGQTFDNQMVGLISFHLRTCPAFFGCVIWIMRKHCIC